MYLSRSSLVFYILKEKQNSYSILFSKAEPFLIISIFYVISMSDNQHTNVQLNFIVLSFPRPPGHLFFRVGRRETNADADHQ